MDIEGDLSDILRQFGAEEEPELITPERKREMAQKRKTDKERYKREKEEEKQERERLRQLKNLYRIHMNSWKLEQKMAKEQGNLQLSIYRANQAKAKKLASKIDVIPAGKAMYEIDEMMPKKTGKGSPMIAANILLANAIQKMISQSKIVSMFLENVGKALGLLLDLVLIPFLPLLVWALINLYNAVNTLGQLWEKLIPDIPEGGSLFDWGKFVVDFGAAMGQISLLLTNPLAGVLSFITSLFAPALLSWLNSVNEGIKQFFLDIVQGFLTWSIIIGEYISTALMNVIEFFTNVKDSIVEAFTEAFNALVTIKDKIVTALTSIIGSIVDSVYNSFKKLYDMIMSLIPEPLKNGASTVNNAVSNVSNAVNNIVNVSGGITIDGLQNMITDMLRQTGSRFNL